MICFLFHFDCYQKQVKNHLFLFLLLRNFSFAVLILYEKGEIKFFLFRHCFDKVGSIFFFILNVGFWF